MSVLHSLVPLLFLFLGLVQAITPTSNIKYIVMYDGENSNCWYNMAVGGNTLGCTPELDFSSSNYLWEFYSVTTINSTLYKARLCRAADGPCLTFASSVGNAGLVGAANLLTFTRQSTDQFTASSASILPNAPIPLTIREYKTPLTPTVMASVSPALPTYSTGNNAINYVGSISGNEWYLYFCLPTPASGLYDSWLYMKIISTSGASPFSATFWLNKITSGNAITQSSTMNSINNGSGFAKTGTITIGSSTWLRVPVGNSFGPTNCFVLLLNNTLGVTVHNQFASLTANKPLFYSVTQ
jgi:hypothetical protein